MIIDYLSFIIQYNMLKQKRYLILAGSLALIAVFVLGTAAGYFGFKNLQGREEKNDVYFERSEKQGSERSEGSYVSFLVEVYDKIQANYWEKISDEELSTLFKLGAEKLTEAPQVLNSKDKDGFKKMLTGAIKQMPEDKKKEFSTSLANIVLNNLKPFGRSALYTQKDEQNLKNRVQNINPETDPYKTLGLNKNASESEIREAYQKKISELGPEKDKSPEAKKELEEYNYAYQILSSPEKKEKYDQFGIEPTVATEVGQSDVGLIRPDIWYIHIKKISPTTFEEFQKEANKIDQIAKPTTLILDLRGNVGGSIDLLPYFLGPFIGQDQYAFEFYHQEERTPFKTLTGWLPSLVRYKKVIILIDEGTQSSAEVMAAVLKKYNVGITVGRPTRGWGTVEKVFNIEQQIDPSEKYSMFLVHSLTLRDDGQPIEGKGVSPLINIDDKDWPGQLLAYFNYPDLVESIKEILRQS